MDLKNGHHGYMGAAFGNGLFIQGNQTVTFDGDTTVSGVIADESGSVVPEGDGTGTGAGALAITGGTLTLSADNTYSGGTTITDGTLDLAGANAGGSGTITFAGRQGSPATLTLASAAQRPSATFQNTLAGFGADDSLDLAGLAYTSGHAFTGETFTSSGNETGTLSVTEDGKTEKFNLTGVPAGTSYYAHNDGNGGTLINTVCFCAGTRLCVVRDSGVADMAVENLAIGDLVITASGAARPIRWLGHRSMDFRRHQRPREVMPIRVAAHAFGDNRPSRDLFLSPGHAICLDLVGEVLIPVSALINGATVRQLDVDEVTYWHVELDSHDILLAENLPCESYLDMGNRGFFAGGGVVALDASPDAGPATRTHADFCRPFLDAGPLVEGIKGQLRRRAADLGWALTDALELHLEVDGRRLDPAVRGLSARFRVPAGTDDIWLVSPTSRPCEMRDSPDTRDLGLHVAALRIIDGLSSPCAIAIDDPLLGSGFHEVEEDGCRWTAARARLPSALWEDRDADFYLCLDLAGMSVPRWQSPPAETVNLMKLAV